MPDIPILLMPLAAPAGRPVGALAGSLFVHERLLERSEKGLTPGAHSCFERLGAIASAARAWLRAIKIATIIARMSIFDADVFEVLLPIGQLFGKRFTALANFYPGSRSVFQEPRLPHVAQILVTRYRPMPQGAVLDGLPEIMLAAWFHFGGDKIAH